MSEIDTRHICQFGFNWIDSIQMDVGRCLPHMWGFGVGICGEDAKTPPEKYGGVYRNTLFSSAFLAYIKPSSVARLTAARRLLTLSLL